VALAALDPLPGDRLLALLHKPPTLTFRGDREDPAAAWRFVRGHADASHVVAVPGCIGWDPRLLALQPYRELTLHPTGDPDPAFPGGYRVTYETVPVACP
jgi:hypothetical protein